MPFRLRAVRDHQPGGDGVRDPGRGHAGRRHQGSRRRRGDRPSRPAGRTCETGPGDHPNPRGSRDRGEDGEGRPAARPQTLHLGPDRGKDPGIVSVVDVMVSRFDDAIVATDRALRASRPMRNWLGTLRWCGDSIHGTTGLTVKDRAILSESGVEAIVLFLLHATDPERGARPLHLPLSIASARLDPTAFELEADDNTFYVMEAERRESFARFAVDAFRRAAKVTTESGDSLSVHGQELCALRGASLFPGGCDTTCTL